MSVLDLAKRDLRKYTTDTNGFAVSIVFEALNYAEDTATITGLFTEHYIGVNPDNGQVINSQNAHISFYKELLTEVDYPTDTPSLRNHKVTVNGGVYLIREQFPDNTLGYIVCMLESYE